MSILKANNNNTPEDLLHTRDNLINAMYNRDEPRFTNALSQLVEDSYNYGYSSSLIIDLLEPYLTYEEIYGKGQVKRTVEEMYNQLI